MTEGLYGLMGGVLVAIVTGIFGYFTKREEKRSAGEVSIYSRVTELEKRVDDLERSNNDLRVLQRSLVDHIEDIYRWLSTGAQGVMPPPPHRIRDLIDPVYWEKVVALKKAEDPPHDGPH